MSRSPGLVKPERKTRRTHKNSRDGCPNCRAKRIKCTEELPSCSNCVKKHYRCGYLDFPKERLDHIRRKNELKRQQERQSCPDDSSHKLHANHDDGMNNIPSRQISSEPNLRQGQPQTVDQSLFTDRNENFRSQVYTTVFSDLNNQDISLIREMQQTDMKPWQDILDLFKSSITQDGISASSSSSLWPAQFDLSADNTPRANDPQLDMKIETPDFETASHVNKDSLPGGTTPNTGSDFDNGDTTLDVRDEFKSGQLKSRPVSQARRRLPLPHAIHKIFKFTRHETPPHLVNPFLQSALRDSGNGRIALRNLTNDKFTSVVQPVWREEEYQEFWLSIFNQAAMLNLYFVYFIDKAVNISKRTAQIVVNHEFDISNQSSVGLTSNCSSPLSNTSLSPSSMNQRLSDFFYNPDDLKRLNRLLYVTYGKVLRSLRESVMNYHEEYPIKMSMFSAWACFWNTSSDISTLCMMITGALTLANRLLNEARTINDVSIAVRQEMMILNNHACASVFPDFLFNAIGELAHCFHGYRRIVSDLLYTHENGLAKFEPVTLNVLQNPIFKYNIHEMSTFLKKLQRGYIPQIRAIDSYFKTVNGMDTTGDDIKFASPSLLYNLMYDWFRIFRGEKFSLVSNTSIIHRTLCLFFHALGRCLAHCLTPIRSILLLDPINVIAPKFGFAISQPKYEQFADFEKMYQIDLGLVRMIRFFEQRQNLYGFHMGHTLVSDYIVNEPNAALPELEFKDIIRLTNEKLRGPEMQPTNLTTGTFYVQHFPIFESVSQDPECYHHLLAELERQNAALQSEPWMFDYKIGLLNHDFQPQKVVEAYMKKRQNELMRELSPGLEDLRAVSEHFTKSGRELITAIKKGRVGGTDSE